MHVNLLPKRYRVQLMLRAQLRQWSKIWAACLVAVVALNVVRGYQVMNLRSQLAALQQRSGPVVRTQQEITRTSRQIRELTAQAEATERIQPTDHSLPLLGILAHSTHSTGGHIQIVRLTVQSTVARHAASNNRRRKPAGADAPSAGHQSSLSIQGIATDDHQLSRFVTSLRQFQVFENVDLRSSSRMSAVNDQAREFQLECRY